ncbi:MAG: hypothetical protein RBS77_00540 [Candidatus Moranbacteria bacterium]|jgi:hypothetical protein|nr:hypothetical protein [Candidatus Moranbacteria bacterium]
MIPYQAKSKKIAGTSYGEVLRNAFRVYDEIKKKTKRRPYVRSAYFKKEKIFLDYFREHIFQKPPKERMKRLKYFKATVELIQYSKNAPASKENPHRRSEILHRFAGLTKEKELFFVQIKEDKKKKKYLMSCFPPE